MKLRLLFFAPILFACSTPGTPRTGPDGSDAADAAPADNGFPPMPPIMTSTGTPDIRDAPRGDDSGVPGEVLVDLRHDAGVKKVKKPK